MSMYSPSQPEIEGAVAGVELEAEAVPRVGLCADRRANVHHVLQQNNALKKGTAIGEGSNLSCVWDCPNTITQTLPVACGPSP